MWGAWGLCGVCAVRGAQAAAGTAAHAVLCRRTVLELCVETLWQERRRCRPNEAPCGTAAGTSVPTSLPGGAPEPPRVAIGTAVQ